VYLRRSGLLLLLAALLVVLSACGGGGDGGEEEEPQAAGTTAGFTTYEVDAAGFSVAVPSSWRTVRVQDIVDEEFMNELLRENPELEPLAEAMAGPDSIIKLFAADPAVVEGFATNLNVIVEPAKGFSQQEYFDATVENIERLSPETELAQERASLPAGDALVLRYTEDSPPKTAILQYVLFRDEAGYVLTYTTLPKLTADYEETFSRSARSFRVSG
jgi:hypothetical protein